MSSLKKLKKLNKVAKAGNKQLAKLRRPVATAPVTGNSNATVMQQLGGITKQAGLSAVRELATPLNPLLSWFEGGHNLRFTAANQIGAAVSSNRAAVSSIAQLPLKSPPCKSCPAKVGGLCKCARKKFGV